MHSRRDQLTLSPGINLFELGTTFSFLTLLRRGDKVRSLVQDCLVRALRVDRTLSTWLSVGLGLSGRLGGARRLRCALASLFTARSRKARRLCSQCL